MGGSAFAAKVAELELAKALTRLKRLEENVWTERIQEVIKTR